LLWLAYFQIDATNLGSIVVVASVVAQINTLIRLTFILLTNIILYFSAVVIVIAIVQILEKEDLFY
jgi:hypothetical protein